MAALLLAVLGAPAGALDNLEFSVAGGDKSVEKTLRGASLLIGQSADSRTDPEDLFTAARSDYGRLLAALYAAGYYGPTISITIDGREASSIPPLDAPSRIGRIQVKVDPGRRFVFSRAEIAPLAYDTELPKGFASGEPAEAGLVQEAVSAAVLGWREAGHAKVRTLREDVVADHARGALSADIRMEPGPVLRFGPMTVKGAQRMELRRLIKIAGLREGEQFSQSELDRAANRLRRTGVFSSVTMSEGERVMEGGLLPITVTVTEQKTRRYSIGAELASEAGLSLTGYWLHRNLLGGGERFKIDTAITNIGAANSGMDYELGFTIDRPATITADTTASLSFRIGHLDEEDYNANFVKFGLTFLQYYSDSLTLSAGVGYEYIKGKDDGGDFEFRNLSLPMKATWDRRDNTADARKGFYIDGGLKPFYGFSSTGSGARLTLDMRGYRSFGADDRVTLALRLQGGAILGSGLLETPRDDLFFSGGGGTVRGQPYRSLGVIVNRNGEDVKIGGTEMAVASAEVRSRITDTIGLVGFVDAGHVAADDMSGWQAGAGLGLRYETGFGPIRFDVAAPVGGDTGDGMQFYIGLGQAF